MLSAVHRHRALQRHLTCDSAWLVLTLVLHRPLGALRGQTGGHSLPQCVAAFVHGSVLHPRLLHVPSLRMLALTLSLPATVVLPPNGVG